MEIIWNIYAIPGKAYATGKNPYGRDLLGFVWATNASEAISKFAARENLDASQLEV